MSQHDINSVLSFWFGNDDVSGTEQNICEKYKTLWFPDCQRQSSADVEVAERFGSLLQQAEADKLCDWLMHPQSCLALILILDQFPRHVYRNNRDKIDQTDRKALKLCYDFIHRGWHKHLSAPQLVFALMPLRHSPNVERLNTVLDLVNSRLVNNKASASLLQRFRKTTKSRLERLEGKENPYIGDILEFHEFTPDAITRAKLPQLPIVHSMLHFLDAHFDQNIHDTIAVSLSGGVDSMVIADILYKNGSKYNFQVTAVHVDYANRRESLDEAKFVGKWCESKNIFLKSRRITEMSRATTRGGGGGRDELMKSFPGCPSILFGHHRGDVQENVISNIMKGRSVLNVAGMSSISIINNVSIWRPLLNHPKKDIFDYSHTFGVPYFKDSTPKWSNRGKLRNNLVPLLKDIYGSGVMSSLSNVAEESQNVSQLINCHVFEPFLSGVKRSIITPSSIETNSKVRSRPCMFYFFSNSNFFFVRNFVPNDIFLKYFSKIH
eukprot:GSMAST32.ASY1.ANO1.534.1 assembled CDS